MSRVVSAVLAVTAAACVSPSAVFTCETSDQCTVGGTCQPNGFCSFPDSTCPTGQRYGEAAGNDLANRCVGDEPPIDAAGDIDGRPDAQPGSPDGRPDAMTDPCTAPFAPDAYGCHALTLAMSANYDVGRTYCQSIGGDLTVLQSVEEGQFIATSMLAPGSAERALMGLDFRSGTWTWVDGTGLTLTNWNAGEPSAGDNIGVIRPDGTWAGRLATDVWFVACEK